MAILRSIVKTILPARFRLFLRAAHRDLVFGRAMRRFLRQPDILTQPGNKVAADLIYGWGNESWSALDEYIVGCIEQALILDGPVLECGSGLSTLLIGAIAKSRCVSHWALEHHPEWAARVQSYLDRYGIDSVALCIKPLRDYGEFSWYDPPLESMPDSFAMVICDGPPGDTKGGRYGLGSVMKPSLRAGCVILLDDAGREQEIAVAKRWQAELDAPIEVIGDAKPYIRMTVRGA